MPQLILRHFSHSPSETIHDLLRPIGHELQFAIHRNELPAFFDPHLRLFETERVNARRDFVPLARRQDVGQRLLEHVR